MGKTFFFINNEITWHGQARALSLTQQMIFFLFRTVTVLRHFWPFSPFFCFSCWLTASKSRFGVALSTEQWGATDTTNPISRAKGANDLFHTDPRVKEACSQSSCPPPCSNKLIFSGGIVSNIRSSLQQLRKHCSNAACMDDISIATVYSALL